MSPLWRKEREADFHGDFRDDVKEKLMKKAAVVSHGELTKTPSLRQPVLVIGIGTEFRGDDEAGLRVVRALQTADLPPSVTVVEMKGDGAALMELWKGTSQVILVDAITAGLPPGSVIRIDARRELVTANLFATSSHSFGVAQALAISLALHELPLCVTLFGIQAGNLRMGSDLSAEVQKAVPETSDAIQRELTAAVVAEQSLSPS